MTTTPARQEGVAFDFAQLRVDQLEPNGVMGHYPVVNEQGAPVHVEVALEPANHYPVTVPISPAAPTDPFEMHKALRSPLALEQNPDEVPAWQVERERISETSDRSNHDVSEFHASVESLYADWKKATDRLGEIDRDLPLLDSRIAQKTAQLPGFDESISEDTIKVRGKQVELAQLKTELEPLEKTQNTNKSSYDKIHAIAHDPNSVENKMEALEAMTQVFEAREDVPLLQQIHRLDIQLAPLLARKSELEDDEIPELKGQIELTERTKAQIQLNILNMQEKIAELIVESAGLRQYLDEKSEWLKKLKVILDAMPRSDAQPTQVEPTVAVSIPQQTTEETIAISPAQPVEDIDPNAKWRHHVEASKAQK
jgi:hypothetical protein